MSKPRLAVWPDYNDDEWAIRLDPDSTHPVAIIVGMNGRQRNDITGGPNLCQLWDGKAAPIISACRNAMDSLGLPHADGMLTEIGVAMVRGALNMGIDLPVWPAQKHKRFAIGVTPLDIQGLDWARVYNTETNNALSDGYLCEYNPPEARGALPVSCSGINTEALDHLGLPHNRGVLTPEGVAMVMAALDTRPTLPVWPTTVRGHAIRRGHGDKPDEMDNIFLVDAMGERVLSGSLCPLEDDPEHDGYSGVNIEVCKVLGLESTGTHATAKACVRARRAIRLANAWTPPAPPKPEYEPLFTPFHYEALAAAFRGVFTAEYARRKAGEMPLNDTETTARVIRETADILAIDNPHFDRAKFYADCGCLPDGSPDYNIES